MMRCRNINQQGAILLTLLLAFFVSGATVMLGVLNNRQDAFLAQQSELRVQMQLAREALLAYAANSSRLYGNERGPGFLPCPDTDMDGQPEISCNDTVNIGRLPAYIDIEDRRFTFNDFYAGTDQQFWYAVSATHVYASSGNIAGKRTSTETEFRSERIVLDNTSDIVALIIAPGEAFNHQNRGINPAAYSNYLESGNGSGLSYISSDPVNPDLFNDQVMAITHDELMIYISLNVANEIKTRLDAYYVDEGRYPLTSSAFYVAIEGGWISSELWDAHGNGNGNGNWDWLWAWLNGNNVDGYINYTYSPGTPNSAVLSFADCPNISFQIDRTDGITRSGDEC